MLTGELQNDMLFALSVPTVLFGDLEFQGLDLSEQGARVYTQFPGCGGPVAPMSPEGVGDMDRLQFLQRDARLANPGSTRFLFSKSGREVSHLNQTAPAEDERMFDDVLQLADIAWIIMLHQDGHDLFGNAGNGFVLQAVELGDEVRHEEGDVLSPIT